MVEKSLTLLGEQISYCRQVPINSGNDGLRLLWDCIADGRPYPLRLFLLVVFANHLVIRSATQANQCRAMRTGSHFGGWFLRSAAIAWRTTVGISAHKLLLSKTVWFSLRYIARHALH
jgi:hypothetical protein